MNNSEKLTDISSNNSKIKEILLDIFDIVIKSLIILLILTTFVFKICTVIGSSMEHTLQNGDKLIISNLFYSPKENDVVVFHQTGSLNEPVVKRVIATGGKWVRIDYDNQLLYVSSDDSFEEEELVDESSYIYLSNGYYNMMGTHTVYVPEGFLFVMGDNRNNSSDSRSDEIGLVDQRTILGKAIIRFSPISKFGFIN